MNNFGDLQSKISESLWATHGESFLIMSDQVFRIFFDQVVSEFAVKQPVSDEKAIAMNSISKIYMIRGQKSYD